MVLTALTLSATAGDLLLASSEATTKTGDFALASSEATTKTAPMPPARRRVTVAAAWWNVENLFDWVRDPRVFDGDFTPGGANRWTPERYNAKLDNIASVIARLAPDCAGGPAVIGLAEVENRDVVEDLIRRPAIARRRYAIVHRESPDRRGIDVAMLYRPEMFTPEGVRTYRYTLPADTLYRSRDQLLVSGRLHGARIHFILCHWPSRYGGRLSERLRLHAAAITRRIVDSLHTVEPGARVVVMGDMNDNPDDRALRTGLGAAPGVEDALGAAAREPGRAVLYNAAWPLWRRGVGTLVFLGRWQLFDQTIVSASLLGGESGGEAVAPRDDGRVRFTGMEVFDREFLISGEGRYRGAPRRTFRDGAFDPHGASDHLPVVARFEIGP
jgi:endonuclease/exonuclease/phosphatase family metal-dependent hydrolase